MGFVALLNFIFLKYRDLVLNFFISLELIYHSFFHSLNLSLTYLVVPMNTARCQVLGRGDRKENTKIVKTQSPALMTF